MKRTLIISLVVIVLVGACTATLLFNKKRIDEKAKMDGNLSTIPVFVTTLAMSELTGTFTSNGSFSAVHELTLMSEGQGTVEGLFFDNGDFIPVGKVMAQLDDELVRSQLSLAETALEKARKDMKKFEDLLSNDAVSSQQVEEVRLALKKAETDVIALRKQLANTSIKAPIQGTVTRRMIEKGSLVMPGTPVAEIVDVSRLKFVANVAENEAVQLRKGQTVTITSTLFPGITYTGTILSVGVKADETRRFPVEIEIINDPAHPLKDGMFGTATFASAGNRQALMVPRHALIGSIREPRVYVVENGRALVRPVRIGSFNDHEVEVTDGLKAGEVVVTAGQINLDENTPVTIVNKR